MNAVIIGAGLFGRVVGRALELRGEQVTWFDSAEPYAGSAPAACLMKPSWLTAFTAKEREEALQLLDRLYGVQELKFHLGPAKVGGVMWVPPKAILRGPVTQARVAEVTPDRQVVLEDGTRYQADIVVVAAGVWTNRLLGPGAVPGLVGQAGVAFTWAGPIVEPFVRPWAPYRQVVGFQRDVNEAWVSDGTALREGKLSETRIAESLARCQQHAGISPELTCTATLGIRPYVPGAKRAYLREHHRRFFVATGGAKNGTLAAAWCALEIMRRL